VSAAFPLIHNHLASHQPTQEKVKLLINGEFVDSKTSKWVDVVCPVRWLQELRTCKGLGWRGFPLQAFLMQATCAQRTLPLSRDTKTQQATQTVLSKLPLTTPSEFDAAVAAAKAAFPAWRDTPVPTRARVMLKLQQLIRENWVR